MRQKTEREGPVDLDAPGPFAGVEDGVLGFRRIHRLWAPRHGASPFLTSTDAAVLAALASLGVASSWQLAAWLDRTNRRGVARSLRRMLLQGWIDAFELDRPAPSLYALTVAGAAARGVPCLPAGDDLNVRDLLQLASANNLSVWLRRHWPDATWLWEGGSEPSFSLRGVRYGVLSLRLWPGALADAARFLSEQDESRWVVIAASRALADELARIARSDAWVVTWDRILASLDPQPFHRPVRRRLVRELV